MDFNSLTTAHGYEHVIDPRWVQFMTDLLDGRRIIADVGGGPGRYALALRSAGFQVSVYDGSEAMVEEALLNGIDAYHANAENLPVEDGGVSAVIMRTVVHHLKSCEQAFTEAFRMLDDHGIIVIQTRSESDLHASPMHQLLGDEKILARDWKRWPNPEHLGGVLRSTGFRSVKVLSLTEHEGTESREALVRRIKMRGGDSLFHLLDTDKLEKLVRLVEATGKEFFHRESTWTALVGSK